MNCLRYIILITFVTISLSTITAQENETNAEIQPFDSIVGLLPESLESDKQFFIESQRDHYFLQPEKYCEDEKENPYFPDSIYRARIAKMPFVIPMTYNAPVRKCIDLYAGRLRDVVRRMMGLGNFYFPMIEQKLDANNLPLELKYLAVVESALNPVAQSRAGASGLWQFMLPTGKVYNLEINSLIDERFDPERATDAACLYFQRMYERYDDWLLALAAYNCGPGSVDKAIRRSGGKTDFWKIFQYLPRETRSYVPLFMAAAYIMTYHCEHNICPIQADFPTVIDTIMVERPLHFDQIANVLQIEKDIIRFYNPQYRREIIPGNVKPCVLRLPLDKTTSFVDRENNIYSHRIEELLAGYTVVDPDRPNSRKETITHTVKDGETLLTIAGRYGVTVKDLRRWNGLSGSRAPKGKKLKITIDNGGVAYANRDPEPAPQTTNQASKPDATTKNATSKPASASISYKVKSGDTLYSIAKRYPGISAGDLQEFNGLSSSSLRIGQVIKIPQG